MNKRLLLPILFAIATTAGCSMAPYQHSSEEGVSSPKNSSQQPNQQPTQTQSKQVTQVPYSDLVKASLYRQHREWKGTRYQLGGMSKRGIDCSALVYLTYRDHMGIELPRTTELQALEGREIKRDDLRAGDLVFFRTGRRGRHVGIYIEDGKFFHASASKGVTISHMADYYWKNRYWRARRLDLTDGK
ncbi:NlpC/P60 family protein [Microbulbifer sp.]|uniref:NlpC/P60 family protein n=1 Tax=Microbulbifer sp. TaxID=1908541 RepID=UPI002F934F68